MIWFFLFFAVVSYPKVSRFDGLHVYNFNITAAPTPTTDNRILWDDSTAILWDDNTAILWDSA